MNMRRPEILCKAVLCVALLAGTGYAKQAVARNIVPCDGACTWSMEVDGVEVQTGDYTVDPVTGAISLPGPVIVDLGDGASVSLNSLSGNADPILGFNASASTGATGKTFSFAFSLPISLSGPLAAASAVSYSLTSTTAAGAQVDPLFGHTVVAQEVDTSIGGLSPLNKGVDVGDRFFFTGQDTRNSPVYKANSTLTGNSAYDLMSVVLGFSLSANSNVGMSGFVSQSPVPLPAAVWLLGSALMGLRLVSGRRREASF